MPAEFHWVHASNGHVPPHAVESGNTVEGEMLYVGRAFQNGIPCVGKVSSLFRIHFNTACGNIDQTITRF